MGAPKRIPDGQVKQQNMEVQAVESNPTGSPGGSPLKMEMVDGKTGKAESIGLPQTAVTE